MTRCKHTCTTISAGTKGELFNLIQVRKLETCPTTTKNRTWLHITVSSACLISALYASERKIWTFHHSLWFKIHCTNCFPTRYFNDVPDTEWKRVIGGTLLSLLEKDSFQKIKIKIKIILKKNTKIWFWTVKHRKIFTFPAIKIASLIMWPCPLQLETTTKNNRWLLKYFYYFFFLFLSPSSAIAT